jgi:hypothetical protein
VNRPDKRYDGNNKKTANFAIGDTKMKDGGYGKLSIAISVCHFSEQCINTSANIPVCVCANIFMFCSYHVAWNTSMLMENGSRASVHGTRTIDLNFYPGKIVAEEHATCLYAQ